MARRLFSYSQAVVADGSGAATVYFGQKIHGRLLAIKYAPGTLDTGADLVITAETSGQAILTKTNAGTSTVWYYPRAIPNKIADASAFSDAAVDVFLFGERVKLVVAQGGAAGAGTMTVFTEEYLGK